MARVGELRVRVRRWRVGWRGARSALDAHLRVAEDLVVPHPVVLVGGVVAEEARTAVLVDHRRHPALAVAAHVLVHLPD